MKMRGWIGVLLLLNLVALAWQWDAFARWGWGPNVQREPERLQQQIKPEALQFTLPGQAAVAPVGRGWPGWIRGRSCWTGAVAGRVQPVDSTE